jgi:metacaspase-1
MPKGLSLHIGLNFVDPKHYDGWDGELAACEFDANDMAALAKARGFKPTKLIRKDATVKAVKKAILDVGTKLAAGDTFFLTYSGHGGQVADTNADEGMFGDTRDRKDETWCLFDRQLVDDEIAALFASFKKGVRILVLSDSCHSGSVTRGEPRVVGRTRLMPRSVASRVFDKNAGLYNAIQAGSKPKEMLKVKATVLLISGCQDNQLSSDGDRNGLFTETVLDVWADGEFSGGYREFHDHIVAAMPEDQTPNFFSLGAPNPEFLTEQPFSIKPRKAAAAKKATTRGPKADSVTLVIFILTSLGYRDGSGKLATKTSDISDWFSRVDEEDKAMSVPGPGRVNLFIGLIGERLGVDLSRDDLINGDYATPQEIADLA